MPLPLALAAAAPGLIQAAGSLFGSGKRKREQRAAQAQFDQDLAGFRNTEFTNPYANLENTAEDLTVNQQAFNAQAQQTDQALAQGLDAIVASGGGGGGAQAIANAALQSKQDITSSIAAQEQQNQVLRAQQAAQLQANEAAGADQVASRQFMHQQQLLNLSSGRLQQANQARQQATKNLVSGLGSAVGAFAGAGGFGGAAGGAGGGGALASLGGGGGAGAQLGSISQSLPSFGSLASDPRMKENIKKVGESDSGVGIYTFNYKGKKGKYKGTISTDAGIPKDAVTQKEGYDFVNYDKLDVPFEKISDE